MASALSPRRLFVYLLDFRSQIPVTKSRSQSDAAQTESRCAISPMVWSRGRETFAPAPGWTSAEKLAKQVPNAKQVVNDAEVKGKEATSTR